MKLQEQFKLLKQTYPNHVIFLKKGMFYTTYYSDAILLNYLLSYQISSDRVGFPVSSISKVLKKLETNQINVYIIDTNEKIEYEKNQYENVLFLAKKNYFHELNSKVLLEEIEFLLKSNPKNIEKIKNFISEL